jgi:hypothetical protein
MADTTVPENTDPTKASININYDQPTVPVDAVDSDTGEATTYEQPIEEYYGSQATQPGLPSGTTQTYAEIEPDEGVVDPETGEVTTPSTEFIDPTLAEVDEISDTSIAKGVAEQIKDPELAELLEITNSTYEAFEIEAAQGEVTPQMLLRHQLSLYMADLEAGNASWADAAIRKANEIMLKRGLVASSMAGAAIATAILEAAVPLAEFDAAVFGEMELQNLRNRHDTLLSNQSAKNASLQFNAQTQGELDQFVAGLRDRVLRFNAEQLNSMETFNVDQTNSVKMFYDKLESEIDRFEVQNILAIAQSNVEWRRSLNMANTTAENAAIAVNVENRFNISQTALNNLWQQARDVFHWANTASENARDRAFQIILNSTARDEFLSDLETAESMALAQNLGDLAFGLIEIMGKGWIETWDF